MTHASGPYSTLSLLLVRLNHDFRRVLFSSLSVADGASVLAVDELGVRSDVDEEWGFSLRRRDVGLDAGFADNGRLYSGCESGAN
jgi:hypothetical protein